jgi:hypothetical protein
VYGAETWARVKPDVDRIAVTGLRSTRRKVTRQGIRNTLEDGKKGKTIPHNRL